MILPLHRLLGLAFAAVVLQAMTWPAYAQSYPVRPITFIVPYPPGGPTDLIARTLGERMHGVLGQSIIVENVPGAGGTIGIGRVARAAPDGYTLGIGNTGSNVLNAALYSLPFDLIGGLAPIAQLTTNPQIIITKKSIPAANLKELIAWLQDNQAKVSVGIAGSLAQVNAIKFQSLTSTKFKLVPYRGAAPAVQDLVGGHIELMFDQLSNALPQVRAGTVNAYAVAAADRSASAPEIPTVDEAGLPGFYGSLWHGMWAPRSTPSDVIGKVHAAALQALADPAIKKRLSEAGQEVVPVDQQSPNALAAYQKSEADKWLPIVKAANLKGD